MHLVFRRVRRPAFAGAAYATASQALNPNSNTCMASLLFSFYLLAHPECVFRGLPVLLSGFESRATTVDPDGDRLEILLVARAASIRQFVETV